MKLTLAVMSFVIFLSGSIASAAYTIHFKKATCASGQLNEDGIVEVGAITLSYMRHVVPEKGFFLETENDGVYIVKVSGSNAGVCANNGVATTAILTFEK